MGIYKWHATQDDFMFRRLVERAYEWHLRGISKASEKLLRSLSHRGFRHVAHSGNIGEAYLIEEAWERHITLQRQPQASERLLSGLHA